ncbi:GNAT family N-acetyltransferase [Dactylosporangium siamense]|nr:GNAT family N-acetyltransferase [Dactylosporangium siamense]
MSDVRAALPGDLPAAVEVWHAANAARGLPPTASRLTRVREKLTAPDATVLVATLPRATPSPATLTPATGASTASGASAAAGASTASGASAAADAAAGASAGVSAAAGVSAGVPAAMVRPAAVASAVVAPDAVASDAVAPAVVGSDALASASLAPADLAPADLAAASDGFGDEVVGPEVVVGMALVEPGRADDGTGEPVPGYGHVSMVFVHPSYWSNGYGQQLLRAVNALGWTRTTLWTRQSNSRAQRLYAAAGYTPTGRVAHLHDGDAIIQLEHLTGASPA